MSGLNHYDGSREYSQDYPKSFVATRPFGYDFFTYTVSMNSSFVKVGTLALVTTNPGLCPAGRVLHVTGAKLYPNINPMNTFPTANTYTSPIPAFNARISGTVMTVNSVARGTIFVGMLVLGVGVVGGTYVTAFNGGGGTTGNYTVNVSQSFGDRDLNGSAQNGTLLTARKFLLGVYDPISNLRGFIDPTLSMFGRFDQLLPNSFDLGPTANTSAYGAAQAATPLGGLSGKLTLSDAGLSVLTNNFGVIQAGAAASGTASINGGTANGVTITTTACTATSKIFLTGSTANVLYDILDVSAGSFRIRTNNTTNLYWIVVN